jgi:uncharacterized protein (TIGR02217 family)
MSSAVFSPPPGLKWDYTRTPIWSTSIVQSVAGREYRIANFNYPRYSVTLSFDVLRESLAYQELSYVTGFFNARKGSYDSFLFSDPDDHSVTDQGIGVGTGSATQFQLVRAFGGFSEPVYDITGNQSISVGNTPKVEGVDFNISAVGMVTFTSPPAGGQSITWTGSYYRRMRFKQDMAEFSKFMYQLWELRSIEMVSVLP